VKQKQPVSQLADLCREQEKGSQRLLVLGDLVP
jgi:hypothetical protein